MKLKKTNKCLCGGSYLAKHNPYKGWMLKCDRCEYETEWHDTILNARIELNESITGFKDVAIIVNVAF